MKLRCTECGYVFDENELSYWSEPHGERLSGCPNCHGTCEEVEPCDFCGECENVDEYLKVCDKCSYLLRERLADLIKKEFTVYERKFFSKYYEEGMFYDEK
jgi:hypothetical protein